MRLSRLILTLLCCLVCCGMSAQRRVTPVKAGSKNLVGVNENKQPGDSIDRSRLVSVTDDRATRVLYSFNSSLLPVGETSISLRINPDLASVIFTGLFVPINKKHLNLLEYVDLNFSLTVISS